MFAETPQQYSARVKIECILTNPLLVEHIGPVFRALLARGIDAAFVCTPPAARFVRQRRHKLALHERCVAAAHAADLPCFSAVNPRADIALTALGSNQLHLHSGIKLKLRYGVSLHRAALHHNFAMTYGFDGVLVHGAFERDLFARWIAPERIRVVGMPRHVAHAAPLSSPCDRRVIAYLPTWSALSSLHSFVEPLCRLAETHQLLVKPHALSFGQPAERAALAMLERAGARIVAAFAPLVAAAGIVLADATSGAATEAALLAPETPLALLSVREPVELFREVEQLGPLVRSPGALQGLVAQLLEHDPYRAQRAALCAHLFATESTPERAAEALLDLAQLPKISGKPGLFERALPRVGRVLRGQAISLGVKYARMPPRDIAVRDTLLTT
jgi:hypothetical protein